MTWTYDLTALATNPVMQVRYMVGDTVITDKQVQDEEITFAFTQRSSVWGCAAMVCRSLAARLSREADTIDRDLRTMLSARASAYRRMSADYENMALSRSGVMAYAGGISFADKVLNENNADRVPPQFNIGMDDNYLPVSPEGNEGTPGPSGGSGSFNG